MFLLNHRIHTPIKHEILSVRKQELYIHPCVSVRERGLLWSFIFASLQFGKSVQKYQKETVLHTFNCTKSKECFKGNNSKQETKGRHSTSQKPCCYSLINCFLAFTLPNTLQKFSAPLQCYSSR